MLNDILTNALNRLAQLDGLSTREIAARCILTGTIPTAPAFSGDVVNAFQRLELEQTRGNTTTREEVTA
jgi:hypothetical protein